MSLADLTTTGLWTAILVFVRLAAILSLAPIIGERSVPQRVKLALALGMTVLLVPIVAPQTVPPAALPIAIVKEAAVGFLFGLIFRLIVIAIQFGGVIIAQSGSLAQMFQGMADEASPTISTLLHTLALAVAAAFGLQFAIIEVAVRLFDIFPLGQGIAAAGSAESVLGAVVDATVLAFRLSAGFVLAALIYNIVIGFANRVMPQLMLTMIGAPAISLGTLALLFLTFPHLVSVWLDHAEALLAGFR